VKPQSFTICVTKQSGAIRDFGRALRRRSKVLDFGQKCEPAPKSFPIGTIFEPEEIGRAIGAGVAEFERDPLPLRNRLAKAHFLLMKSAATGQAPRAGGCKEKIERALGLPTQMDGLYRDGIGRSGHHSQPDLASLMRNH
jgi:hypothetical protein